MKHLGQLHNDTLISLGSSSFDVVLYPVTDNNLAERIAAALTERRRIEQERRGRERERLLRKDFNAQEARTKRGEPRGFSQRSIALNQLIALVSASRTADAAIREHAPLRSF